MSAPSCKKTQFQRGQKLSGRQTIEPEIQMWLEQLENTVNIDRSRNSNREGLRTHIV